MIANEVTNPKIIHLASFQFTSKIYDVFLAPNTCPIYIAPAF